MDKYDYKMRYVPQKWEVNIFSGDMYVDGCEEKREDDAVCGKNDSVDTLLKAALCAVESMLCMCSMVYMKCMDDINKKI